jgi:uncharacterized protein (TIGR00255 family)
MLGDLRVGLSSMTGFSRTDGRHGDWSWSWEARSVNGKGLDIRIRLPVGYERLETAVRQQASTCVRRGNITFNLTVNHAQGKATYRINKVTLQEILNALPELARRLPDAGPLTLDGILGIRGVLEPVEELESASGEVFDKAVLAGATAAMAALAAMRLDEGARLMSLLVSQLGGIAALVGQASRLAEAQPAAVQARLLSQVQGLLEKGVSLSEERFSQEVALLAAKADIREELDRLRAHTEAARELISGDQAVGRKLDFLCQEFNREANTLCAKSSDVELTRVGLDIKATIEQMREQVQNIE